MVTKDTSAFLFGKWIEASIFDQAHSRIGNGYTISIAEKGANDLGAFGVKMGVGTLSERMCRLEFSPKIFPNPRGIFCDHFKLTLIGDAQQWRLISHRKFFSASTLRECRLHIWLSAKYLRHTMGSYTFYFRYKLYIDLLVTLNKAEYLEICKSTIYHILIFKCLKLSLMLAKCTPNNTMNAYFSSITFSIKTGGNRSPANKSHESQTKPEN